MADEPKIVFKEDPLLEEQSILPQRGMDLDDEKDPSVFQLEQAQVPLGAPVDAPVEAPLEKGKVILKYDLKNFYKETREPIKCGSYCSKLQGFYKAKAKTKDINGDTYGYDADGNLVEKAKGTVVKTIPLPTYRRPTAEEIDEMEKKHAEVIALASREVDKARTALYEMSRNPERDDSTMVRLNRRVMEADSKLCVVRFPLMYTKKEEGVRIRQLDFTQPTETRVLPYAVAIIETRPFTLQEQYVRIGEPAPPPLVSVAEAKSMMKEAGVPIIFFEGAGSDDYGYLSMEWAVVLEYNSTTYRSVHHAIYSELAKLFDDQVHLPQLLAAETAEEVVYSVDDVPGDLTQNREKWNEHLRTLIYEVNLVKFRRYKDLAVKLLETKNAIIGAYEPGDRLIGIGISLENVDSKDPAKWGENVLGKSLMNIRDMLREERAVTAPAVPVAAPARTAARKRPSIAAAASAAVPASVPASVPVPVAASVAVPVPAQVAAPASVPAAAVPSMAIAKPAPKSVAKSVAKPVAAAAAPVAAPVAAPAVVPVAAPKSVAKSVAAPMAAPMAVPMAAPMAVPAVVPVPVPVVPQNVLNRNSAAAVAPVPVPVAARKKPSLATKVQSKAP